MAILIRMCFFPMLFGIYDTTEWKPEIYDKGENVTILQTVGKQNLEITFSGCTSKQHVSNVLIYDSRKNLTEGISINRNYTGRITRMEMNNGTLSVFLLNVNFMDSGNYAVSTLEGSVEKRKKSILVPRTVIRVQDSGLIVVQFMCNKTNISSIIIEMIKPTHLLIAIYDVEEAKCSRYLYTGQIESCVLNGNRFSLTLLKVSWLDEGTYVAWDDKRFLLDSIDLDIQEWKPEIYDKGENVTILQTDGKQNLEITFSGSTSKQHVTNVMTYDSRKNLTEGISINRNYTGRITRIEMNNGILGLLLLNVNFMDSGNYIVSTLEGSVEKGKKSILVSSTVIRVQDGGSLIVQFMCNKTNISSIIIEMIKPTHHRIAIYDVKQANCSGHLYMRHIENCVLNGNRFYLTLQKVSWLDEGTYVAWDDKSFLLDSIDLYIQDGTITSSLETTKEYVTVQSKANAKQNDSNVSNPQSTYSPDTSIPGDENVLSIWLLVSSLVVVLVVTCLAIVAVRKLYQRKGTKSKEEDITCSDSAIRMGAASNTALQSDDDDEREYEEPRSIEMELNACLETISHPVNVYEKLHPYENQGNHIYRSIRPENII